MWGCWEPGLSTPVCVRSEEGLHGVLDDGTEITLAQNPGVVFPFVRAFETGGSNRSILAISLNVTAVAEAPCQDLYPRHDRIGVLAIQSLLEGGAHSLSPAFVVFEAVAKIMGILGFGAMIKCKGFETGEADDIGMTNGFGRHAAAVQKFSGNLDHLVMVENHRRMGDMDCRDWAFRRQFLKRPTLCIARIREEFQDQNRAVSKLLLPAP